MKRLFAIYVTLISLLGCALFLYTWPFSDVNVQNEWFLLLLFAGAVALLDRYLICLPPSGNSFTLESSIYLSLLFVFGLNYTLTVLILGGFIVYFTHFRKMVWWKHVFNFSVYTIMICSAYYVYIVFGGIVGDISSSYLFAYVFCFLTYFILNAILMSIYFSLHSSANFIVVLINTVKEVVYIYAVTMIVSLILSILFYFDPLFGLFLYTFIMLLLSSTFHQYSRLYEKLEDDKVYIEQLLNSLPVGLITIDNSKSNSFINNSATTLLGLDKKEIKQLVEQERKSEKNPYFWGIMTRCDPFQQVKVSYERDGEEKIFLVSQSNLHNLYGEIIGRTIFFLDITEMEQLTKRIHQSEKLALMGEMAAKAAHEIRNPLAVIHGFLAFMNENLHERDREQYHIPLLLKEIDRINAIVEDMLLIAKPSAPVMKETYIETIVQDVLSLFQQTLEAKRIRVHVRLERVPLQLDSKQMMQVLYNLLHNSIEAMEEGGTICIYSDVDETYNMYMYDSGSGIPTHMQETIFEPFITTKSSGTGLGLTIVKRIIENHGGTIALHDSSEQGTTFVIKLPIRR
ncbi:MULTISPECIES: nitrogen regulation protein NR(II) [Anoxybacillus]|uniref:histidine kinase n=1 Tax=Anoxybacillus ayderensis TaxID=265546 RepID=A0A0D0GBV8_9BACL|nr:MULTISPECIES: ATP-binding protein [Anoxybacillus]KIP22705.1 Sporulation kinase A [Anoxybacillus ayderensis]NNU96753.1 PAS domain S-box protein [Anoxybacillus sp. EFIL]